jgi:hypothetical protein
MQPERPRTAPARWTPLTDSISMIDDGAEIVNSECRNTAV